MNVTDEMIEAYRAGREAYLKATPGAVHTNDMIRAGLEAALKEEAHD